jgi:hypothetical protein
MRELFVFVYISFKTRSSEYQGEELSGIEATLAGYEATPSCCVPVCLSTLPISSSPSFWRTIEINQGNRLSTENFQLMLLTLQCSSRQPLSSIIGQSVHRGKSFHFAASQFARILPKCTLSACEPLPLQPERGGAGKLTDAVEQHP